MGSYCMKRFDELTKHLNVLKRAPGEDLENEFIISGIIDKFFIQFELSWKVLKQLLLYEGDAVGRTGSPREIIKAAYARYDFIDEEIWLVMLKERNDTSHVYNEEKAKELVEKIVSSYIGEFAKLQREIISRYELVLPTLP